MSNDLGLRAMTFHEDISFRIFFNTFLCVWMGRGRGVGGDIRGSSFIYKLKKINLMKHINNS